MEVSESQTKEETVTSMCEENKCSNNDPSSIKESTTDQPTQDKLAESIPAQEKPIENSDNFKVPLLTPLEIKKDVKLLKTVDSLESLKPQKKECGDANQSERHQENANRISSKSPAEKLKDALIPLPFKEPKWCGIPENKYSFEVLKSGKIIETIDLTTKPFYVFGRLTTCDIKMDHPSISRYHAIVIHRNRETEQEPAGMYVYDMDSTHGTFVNKCQVKPQIFCPIRVGHVVKLGGSSRHFILQGPAEDEEDESELSVTELVEKRRVKELEKKMEEEKQKLLKEELEKEQEKKKEEEGIDWGLGEDAEEETDLAENPFAAPQNEELYLDDPKKTLRGWFEREGCELEYKVEEKGYGQFLCRVDLPVDSPSGQPMAAEALVVGKKKEAVRQGALEACRILDRFGLLRQSTHESRKKKSKNWEEDDFYDSEEDTFFDRTGTVEKKRRQRMRAVGKEETKVETYDSLAAQHVSVQKEIAEKTSELEDVGRRNGRVDSLSDEDDALDVYMANLKSGAGDKKRKSEIKQQLAKLQQEESRLRKLANLARPADIPELVLARKERPDSSRVPRLFGQKKLSSHKLLRQQIRNAAEHSGDPGTREAERRDDCEEDEEEEEEEGAAKGREKTRQTEKKAPSVAVKGPTLRSEDDVSTKNEKSSGAKLKGPTLPPEVTTSPETEKDVVKGPTLPPDVSTIEDAPPDSTTECPKAAKRHLQEAKKGDRGKKRRTQPASKEGSTEEEGYDKSDPNYEMWVPPDSQSGDGRTKLNEKFGY